MKKIILTIFLLLTATISIAETTNVGKNEYGNNLFGIQLSYPTEWKLFDSTQNAELYQFFIQRTGSKFLACGFLIGETIEEMEGMILINREPFPRELREASIQDLVMLQQQHINNMSDEEKQAITQFPQLNKIGNYDVIFSSINSKGMRQNNYQLIHENTIMTVDFSGIDSVVQYNQTKIEEMLASMNLNKINSFDSILASDDIQENSDIAGQSLNLNIEQDWEEYRNDGSGFKLKHPASWKVYDRDLNPDEFDKLGSKTQLRYVVCALTPSTDISYPLPLMLIQPVSLPNKAKGLDAKAALEVLWEENPLQIKQSVIGKPEIIKLKSFDAMYYVTNPADNFFMETIDVIQGDLIYKISLMGEDQIFMANQELFEAIASSIQFFNPNLASTGRPFHSQNIGSLFWTLFSIIGGIVVLRNPKANNLFAVLCFLYAFWQLYYIVLK